MDVRRTLLTVALTLAPAVLAAQAPAAPADRDAVMAPIRRLFDGMRAGDSAMVRSAFTPNPHFASAAMRQGVPALEIDSLEAFLRQVGTPHPEVYDERLRGELVHVDGPLAVVWTEYSFYVGPRFSHCGVDAFQLINTRDGWRIFALADTRRRTGCPDQPAR